MFISVSKKYLVTFLEYKKGETRSRHFSTYTYLLMRFLPMSGARTSDEKRAYEV